MAVDVATPSKVELLLKVAVEQQKVDQEINVIWGQEVEVTCQVVTPGNPTPKLQLLVNNSVIREETASTNTQATTTYFPTLQESGSR